MEIELKDIIYEKTGDSDIIHKYVLTRQLIFKTALQKQITDLQISIDQESKKVVCPIDASDNMKLAIDTWNAECDNDITLNKDYLQIQLTETQDLLSAINEVI